MKRLWDAGQVAIVEGIGYPGQDLSHFNSMAYWMAGRVGGVPSSGWLGRWLDGFLGGSRDLFAAAEIGTGLPLHVVGQASRATVVPANRPGFGGSREESDQAIYAGVKAMHRRSDSSWQGRVGQSFHDALAVGSWLGPLIPEDDALPDTEVVAKAEIAARLINANLGFRVLTLGWGDFDSHAGQPDQHEARMRELNAALARFYRVLDGRWASRVTVMTFSEFGRTSWGNDGRGTDHGSAAPHFVIGPHVRGGLYGQRPSLAGLRRWDRMPHHVDFRDYFGSVVDGWLGGGASDVFGRTIDNLRLFSSGPGNGATPIPSSVLSGTLVPISSTRVVDTRDGTGGQRRPIGENATLRSKITGVGAVPATGVTAVVANVTTVRPVDRTHLRVFPGNAPRPESSTVNAAPGRAVPNLCIVPVGADGTIQVYNANGDCNAVVDVFAYIGAGNAAGRGSPRSPEPHPGHPEGTGAACRPVQGGSSISLQVTGRGGVPSGGVTAVAVNLTTTKATTNGYVTGWPTGQPRPGTSNLNYVAGLNVPNMAIIPVGAGGKIDLYVNAGSLELVADVVGYFGANGAQLVAVHGRRLLSTCDGIGATQRKLRGGSQIEVVVAGRGGVPTGATGAVLNVTAVNVSTPTNIRVFPSGTTVPNASSLNVVPGGAVANLVLAKLGTGGKVRIFNAYGEVDVIADVSAYFV